MKKQIANEKKKRIRNAAILFLVIAAILTFFSNTIMNASLPEITAQYVTAGTITEKISGSGIVSASDVVSVYPQADGTIKKIAVQSGDSVEAGDLLCTLLPDTETETEDDGYDTAYYAAVRLYMKDGADYEDAATALEEEKTELLAQIYEAYHLSDDDAVSAKKAAITSEQAAYSEYAALVSAESYQKLPETYQSSIANAVQAQKEAEESVTAAQDALTEAQGKLTGDSDSQQEIIDEAKEAADEAYEDYLNAFSIYQTAAAGGDVDADSFLEAADAAWEQYESCAEAYTDAQEQLTKIQNQEAAVSSAEQTVKSAEQTKEEADEALTDALDAVTETLSRKSAVLSLLLLEIDAETTSYEEDGIISVYADVGGVISTVQVSAGDRVTTADVILELVQADSSYSVSFNVSAEKAKKVKQGDAAEVINAEAEAVLRSVRNAIQSDSGNLNEKTLTFTVTGDITVGQTLAVKMDETSQKFEYTVPSSAVNEDQNGKFLFVVQTKSTALGNRYYAKKVSVTVEADDGTNAAVSGNISTEDYVICVSTEALADGDMVRMKETSE